MLCNGTDPNPMYCGCDGHIYLGACVAEMSGQDLSMTGNCVPPAGDFDCGSSFCASATQYCELYGATLLPAPNPSCYPLPDGCNGKTPSCDCVAPQDPICEDVPGGVIVHVN
jgi:hypothetical protein